MNQDWSQLEKRTDWVWTLLFIVVGTVVFAMYNESKTDVLVKVCHDGTRIYENKKGFYADYGWFNHPRVWTPEEVCK